jgi:hypothetical protein
MSKRLLVIGVLLVSFGIAFATHPGSVADYELAGFTADGKYVHFQKKTSSGPFVENWHAVYDAATTKLVTSQPILRDCNGECDGGKPQINDKAGKATVAQLEKKYGAAVAGSLLKSKAKDDAAKLRAAVQTPAGAVQEWTAGDVTIKATSKLLGKLPDLSDGSTKSVHVQIDLVVTVKGATSTATHKFYADPVENEDNGNILQWPALYVQQIAAAPDRKTIAFVFARKPYVLKAK